MLRFIHIEDFAYFVAEGLMEFCVSEPVPLSCVHKVSHRSDRKPASLALAHHLRQLDQVLSEQVAVRRDQPWLNVQCSADFRYELVKLLKLHLADCVALNSLPKSVEHLFGLHLLVLNSRPVVSPKVASLVGVPLGCRFEVRTFIIAAGGEESLRVGD